MSEAKNKLKAQKLNLGQLVESIKEQNADAFGKTNNKRAATIAQAVLSELGQQIAASEEGAISVPGFGRFAVKQKTVEKDGQTVTRKIITFRAKAK